MFLKKKNKKSFEIKSILYVSNFIFVFGCVLVWTILTVAFYLSSFVMFVRSFLKAECYLIKKMIFVYKRTIIDHWAFNELMNKYNEGKKFEERKAKEFDFYCYWIGMYCYCTGMDFKRKLQEFSPEDTSKKFLSENTTQ